MQFSLQFGQSNFLAYTMCWFTHTGISITTTCNEEHSALSLTIPTFTGSVENGGGGAGRLDHVILQHYYIAYAVAA